MTRSYSGLLAIGDPHLASRTPGFRKDEYPAAILGKLRWALDHAEEEGLLPVLLGDLFHYPRDNANWLLTEVMQLFAGREIIGITGNHDCSESDLGPDDSLAVVVAAGCLRLIDRDGPWLGEIGGVPMVIGGTGWSDFNLPKGYEPHPPGGLVFWLTHHNICFGGCEEFPMEPRSMPGIDVVINGHIHRRLDDIQRGETAWLNPGNIARVARAEAVRDARPAVLRIDIGPGAQWSARHIEVPFAPFDDVFHPGLVGEAETFQTSAFVQGLESLTAFKTQGGAGLMKFLKDNTGEMPSSVATEIFALAREVCTDEDI
ncbi:MAG: metallophosphoesterase [Sumerlaeia bacterium]